MLRRPLLRHMARFYVVGGENERQSPNRITLWAFTFFIKIEKKCFLFFKNQKLDFWPIWLHHKSFCACPPHWLKGRPNRTPTLEDRVLDPKCTVFSIFIDFGTIGNYSTAYRKSNIFTRMLGHIEEAIRSEHLFATRTSKNRYYRYMPTNHSSEKLQSRESMSGSHPLKNYSTPAPGGMSLE